jgi:hypothetical protein
MADGSSAGSDAWKSQRQGVIGVRILRFNSSAEGAREMPRERGDICIVNNGEKEQHVNLLVNHA